MYRTEWTPPNSSPSQRWQETWARLLLPLFIWISVSVSLRYGYYGNSRVVLGPSSSRLIKASSIFVEQIQISNDYNKGIELYAFNEEPRLSCETEWSASNFLLVSSYTRKGFFMWLNRGSKIYLRWEVQSSTLNQLQVIVIKGERMYEVLEPKGKSSDALALSHSEPINGKEAEYLIEEDDRYYVGVLNMNARSIILNLNVNVTAKVYDITKAEETCSTANGSCSLNLLFPHSHFVILTPPNNGELGGGWYVEISFVARVVTYIALLGFIVAIVLLILKYLGACGDRSVEVVRDTYETTATTTTTTTTMTTNYFVTPREVTETDPILSEKPDPYSYGTNREDEEDGGSSSSSEDLYDEKLCVICYDEQRNCFFVPCGHCATCYDCAQRIMEGEGKVCPICRRLIHKVRRLFRS